MSITSRDLSSEDLSYGHNIDLWKKKISNYDTQRRIEVLIDFFSKNLIHGSRCLDVGCGLGYFSRALLKYSPLEHTAMDISENLILELRMSLPKSNLVVADLMRLTDRPELKEKFDFIICSEVIEHTPNPKSSIENLHHVLKYEGYLSLSCPNYYWKWLLHIANVLGLRKHYKGYENWLTPFELIKILTNNGFKIVQYRGIHSVPWQFLPKFLLRLIDDLLGKYNFYFALNLAVLCQKKQNKNEA